MAAEDPSLRRHRWQHHFDHLAGPHAHQLVLFGAGHFGKLVLDRLRTLGIEPRCYADNNPQLWGARIHGLEVLSPADAIDRFGQSAAFVVTIFNGSAVRAQLRSLGCPTVIPAPVLFWKYPSALMPNIGIDAPDRLAQEADQIRHCYSLLADEPSRQELCDQIEWRYSMQPEFLPLPPNPGELYFPADLITPNPNEVFVDGGAFDGDSLRAFTRRPHPFQHFYALEPDRSNIAALRASLQTLPPGLHEKVTVWPYALGDQDGQISFVETHDMASSISTANHAISIEARKLDSLPWRLHPTYIKMDIEGSEPAALAGAAQLIRRHMPVLAICLYHRTEHLWQIPNLIHSLAPGYSLHLRRYAEDCWEEVCYAIPPHRLRRQSSTPQLAHSSASN
jgi:FkbM family methyltransferase